MTMNASGRLARLFASPPPHVGVEFTARRVTAVTLARGGLPATVSGYASEPLPEGALVPGLNAANLLDHAAVQAALHRCFTRVGVRPRRVGLVVPDSVAKVSLVRFDQVPSRRKDLDQLILWQVRKAAPFRIEDAQVSYTPGLALPDGGREFVVTLARRDLVAEYESVCGALGAHAGLVDLTSFNLINAVLVSTGTTLSSDWLLVNSTLDSTTLAIVRGRDLIFFRSRPADGEESLTDLVHQTVMYHEDRLGGGGIPRVFLAGASAGGQARADEVRREVEERIGVKVEPVDPRTVVALRDRIAIDAKLVDELASTLGLLLRARAA
jgi:type IV pilus assembly protein PilM